MSGTLLAGVATAPSHSFAAPAIPVVAGLLAVWGVCGNLPRLRGTTLVAPARWTLLSLLFLATTELLLQMQVRPAASTWRYLSAISTLCPTVALLGAKRPQDRGWQFVVASLWIVFALPAAQNLAFSAAGPFELHAAWRGFLALLIGIGLVNQLPTRFAASAVLIAFAQVLLLSRQLPFLNTTNWQRYVLAALPLLAIAVAIASIQLRSPNRAMGWNRVWLDFRDQFGTVWALRVMERVNHAARLHAWSARLSWIGFSFPMAAEADDTLNAEMELSVRTLLRRFVSPEWIDARLSPSNVSDDS